MKKTIKQAEEAIESYKRELERCQSVRDEHIARSTRSEDLLRRLCEGIKAWGSQEDGIPDAGCFGPDGPDLYQAYQDAMELIGGNWETFTRRTNDPKLSWLERQLDKAGIPHRRNGASFHAPILEVPKDRLDEAWKILTPVDDIPDDDDERWNENEDA